MGVYLAKEHVVVRDRPIKNPSTQLMNHLTPKQINILKETWQIIQPNMADTGVTVFKRLITSHPEICKLFKKFMTIKPDGSYDWDTDALQRHAMLVMQALEAAVENLDDTSSLSMILQQLGCKHFAYQVQEHMFNKMWEALVYGLTKTLGKKRMNRETRRTWFVVFRFLANRIVEGMREFRLKVDKD